jgi:hypothetical protein
MGYRRYMLTYPFDGSTIHKTRSFKKAVKKCYKEFKEMNNISEGTFCITDMDRSREYQFKVSNHKIYTMGQSGGTLLPPQSRLSAVKVKGDPKEKKTTVTIESELARAPQLQPKPIPIVKTEMNDKNLKKDIYTLDKLEGEVDKYQDTIPLVGKVNKEEIDEPKEKNIPVHRTTSDIDEIVRRISMLIPKKEPIISPTRIDVGHLDSLKVANVIHESPKKPDDSSSYEIYPYRKPKAYPGNDIVSHTMYELEIIDDFDRQEEFVLDWCNIL